MYKNDRKEIHQYIFSLSTYDVFEGKVEDIFEKIKDIRKYAQQYTAQDLSIFHRFSVDKEYNYDSSDDYNLIGYRWETEEEYNKRVERNKKDSESAKKREKEKKQELVKKEKELYEQLKKKYETKG